MIAEGFTSPARLAISGVSNGGLLVASAMTQRPDLFRAVLCTYPDLDMVRFPEFDETNNIPALAGSGTSELGLPSTRSYGYESQSRPSPSRTCPQPSSGMLVQYAG